MITNNPSIPQVPECGCCYQRFDDELNTPRIFAHCGHTTCTRCLRSIMSGALASSETQIRCPFCKTTHSCSSDEFTKMRLFPTNQQLLDFVTNVQRERANSRPNIQKSSKDKYLCLKHKEETTLFNLKTKEFVCTQCFAEEQGITSVLKVKDMFDQANQKTTNLLENFRNLKLSLDPIDPKVLDVDFAARKDKIITTLKTKVAQLKDLLDHNLNLEIAAVEKAFSKMEYLIKKQGLFGCNLSFKLEQDLSKLKMIEQRLGQGRFELEDVRFLETVLISGNENIGQFFSTVTKNQVLKDLSVSLISKLKKDSLDFIHVVSENPIRIEIRPNQMFVKKAQAAKPEEKTISFCASDAERIKSTLGVLAFADIINGLHYEPQSDGRTIGKFILVNGEYEFLLKLVHGENIAPQPVVG